jgi:hypothetical protein
MYHSPSLPRLGDRGLLTTDEINAPDKLHLLFINAAYECGQADYLTHNLRNQKNII